MAKFLLSSCSAVLICACATNAHAQETDGGASNEPVFTYFRYFTLSEGSPDASLVPAGQIFVEITPVMADGSSETQLAFFEGPKPSDPTMTIRDGRDAGYLSDTPAMYPGQTPTLPSLDPTDPTFSKRLRDYLNGGLRRAAPVSSGLYETFFGEWF